MESGKEKRKDESFGGILSTGQGAFFTNALLCSDTCSNSCSCSSKECHEKYLYFLHILIMSATTWAESRMSSLPWCLDTDFVVLKSKENQT